MTKEQIINASSATLKKKLTVVLMQGDKKTAKRIWAELNCRGYHKMSNKQALMMKGATNNDLVEF